MATVQGQIFECIIASSGSIDIDVCASKYHLVERINDDDDDDEDDDDEDDDDDDDDDDVHGCCCFCRETSGSLT